MFVPLKKRFRGFMPVVIDVETGGFDPQKDALLEVAAILISQDENGLLSPAETFHEHIAPFEGANIEQAALDFIGMDPGHPFRFAKKEKDALSELFQLIRKTIKTNECNRAVLVGHNATFDLSFMAAASERIRYKRFPFHPFTAFDTATLCGMAFGQTVLAKAYCAAGHQFDASQAHSAIYDAKCTAELYCQINNLWHQHVPLKNKP